MTTTSTKTPRWWRQSWFLLLCLILLASLLRLSDVSSRALYEHDEGITLLGVTGHQADFTHLADSGLLNSWQPASNWQQFIDLSAPVSLLKVRQDLNQHDIHPPMYFWLLSLFLQTHSEVDRWAYAVNWCFVVLAILLFYHLLRSRYSSAEALPLTALLALSPVLIGPYAVLRQYELMLFAAVGLLWSLSMALKYRQYPRWFAQLLAFVGFAYIGLMTHAQFLLIILATVTAILLTPLRASQRWHVLLAMLSALVLFWLTNADFFLSLERLERQRQAAGIAELALRLYRLVDSTKDLLGMYPVVAALLVASLLAWALWRSVVVLRQTYKSHDTELELFWLVSALLAVGLVIAQYVSMNAPRHAMGGRYWLPLLPFISLLLSLWLSRSGQLRKTQYLAGLLLCTGISLQLMQFEQRFSTETPIRQALTKAKHIFINNPARGVLSPILPLLPADADVLVTAPEIEATQLVQLLEQLQSGDVVWLQSGQHSSATLTLQQTQLLQKHLKLRPIGASREVFVVEGRW